MLSLQESSHFGAALMTVFEQVASDFLDWHLGRECPELRQDNLCDICEKSDRVSQQISSPQLLTAVLLLLQMQRWRIYSCLTMLSLLPHQGRRWAIQ